jgi:hypothetical protein
MQLAHSTSDCPALASCSAAPPVELEGEVVALRDRDVVAAPMLAGVDVVEVVVLLTDAMLGLFEPPPHPASRSTLASAAPASTRRLGMRPVRFVSMLSSM